MGGCEPAVPDRLLVSSEEPLEPRRAIERLPFQTGSSSRSIVRPLTTTDRFHDCEAGPLSHPEPGRNSGVRSLDGGFESLAAAKGSRT